MSRSLRSKLAPIYEGILPAFFDRPAFEETRATCDDCAMCPRKEASIVASIHFDPETKCCTYHPTLPNYLAGAVFADPSSDLDEGRRRLRQKLAARIGVTPRWLAAPRKFLVHLEASRLHAFGRARSMRCPLYDEGRCTIWKHRESVCSTFFCKHDGGGYARAFWDALKKWTFVLESALTEYAVRQIAPNTTEPRVGKNKMTLEDLEDRPPPPEEYARFWGDWLGREEDFYVACHDVVRQLDAAKVVELLAGRPGAAERLADLEAKYDAVTRPRLANRLVKNDRLESVPAPGGVVVASYSRFDPFFMSDALKEVVDAFRPDETVRDAISRLKRERDLELSDDLVLRLQMLEILVEPATAGPPEDLADAAAQARTSEG